LRPLEITLKNTNNHARNIVNIKLENILYFFQTRGVIGKHGEHGKKEIRGCSKSPTRFF
jgi:hypothetical protein